MYASETSWSEMAGGDGWEVDEVEGAGVSAAASCGSVIANRRSRAPPIDSSLASTFVPSRNVRGLVASPSRYPCDDSFRITSSRLKLAGFWRIGNSLKLSSPRPTIACDGTIRNACRNWMALSTYDRP